MTTSDPAHTCPSYPCPSYPCPICHPYALMPAGTFRPMVESCETVDRQAIIQRAVLAALGCTKIDYRSPARLDKAAGEIAAFVETELTKARM